MRYVKNYAVLLLFLCGPAFAEQVREEYHRTFPISATGQIRLENVNGDVHIFGWDNNEVKVDAVKTADSQRELDEAEILIDATSDRLTIQTKYPRKYYRNDPAEVEYTLMVPRSIHLQDIDLVNGNLTVEGVRGDANLSSVNGRLKVKDLESEAHLSTVNGSMDAVFAKLNKPASLKSVNGSITLSIPQDASAQIDVDTLNGGISNDFGLVANKERYVGRELHGTLKDGAHRIDISTVNGSVHIRNPD